MYCSEHALHKTGIWKEKNQLESEERTVFRFLLSFFQKRLYSNDSRMRIRFAAILQ
jgi:hypothetical protein